MAFFLPSFPTAARGCLHIPHLCMGGMGGPLELDLFSPIFASCHPTPCIQYYWTLVSLPRNVVSIPMSWIGAPEIC